MKQKEMNALGFSILLVLMGHPIPDNELPEGMRNIKGALQVYDQVRSGTAVINDVSIEVNTTPDDGDVLKFTSSTGTATFQPETGGAGNAVITGDRGPGTWDSASNTFSVVFAWPATVFYWVTYNGQSIPYHLVELDTNALDPNKFDGFTLQRESYLTARAARDGVINWLYAAESSDLGDYFIDETATYYFVAEDGRAFYEE